jgi:hypothetical protein
MPWGFVILLVLSVLVFWRARDAGRNPFTRVLVLWGATFSGFLLASLPGYILVGAGAPFEVLPLMAIAGGLAGALWAIRKAGQPPPDKPA